MTIAELMEKLNNLSLDTGALRKFELTKPPNGQGPSVFNVGA